MEFEKFDWDFEVTVAIYKADAPPELVMALAVLYNQKQLEARGASYLDVVFYVHTVCEQLRLTTKKRVTADILYKNVAKTNDMGKPPRDLNSASKFTAIMKFLKQIGGVEGLDDLLYLEGLEKCVAGENKGLLPHSHMRGYNPAANLRGTFCLLLYSVTYTETLYTSCV